MNRILGSQLLRMCECGGLYDGDIVIAFQYSKSLGETTSVYRYKQGNNGSFDVVDIETGDELDMFDLTECDFLVVKLNKGRFFNEQEHTLFESIENDKQEVLKMFNNVVINKYKDGGI